MTIQFQVKHTTIYRYSQPVSRCYNELRLIPRELPHQKCLKTELKILPDPENYHRWEGFFGNALAYFSVYRPHQTLEITAISQIELNPPLPLDPQHSPTCAEVRQALLEDLSPEGLEAREFIYDSPRVMTNAELRAYAEVSLRPERPFLEATFDFMHRIFQDFKFDPGFTTVSTPVETVFKHRRGVCQDFAHLAIGGMRSLGFAARYVSGYLETLPPPGKPRLVGVDASHAWFSVFCPGMGWVDFDPTNDIQPHDRHLTLAWGRDYSDVPPVKGIIFGGGQASLQVSVDVERRSPRSEPSSPASDSSALLPSQTQRQGNQFQNQFQGFSSPVSDSSALLPSQTQRQGNQSQNQFQGSDPQKLSMILPEKLPE